jgi:hypothetical protein
MTLQQQHNLAGSTGSLDGDGAGDHDQPYAFGWRPRSSTPNPFNTRQYARACSSLAAASRTTSQATGGCSHQSASGRLGCAQLGTSMDLEWLVDPRVVRLLLHVLADEREPSDMRIHVLRRLRDGRYRRL